MKEVKIWDLPVRVFHWLLVALILGSYLSSEFGSFDMWEHKLIGYTILGLVVFRILWGFVGSRHARFSDFVVSPWKALAYGKALRQGKKGETGTLGHNPMGGYSVLALLGLVAAQAITGLFANDDVVAQGPLAGYVSDSMSGLLTEVHEIIFNLLLVFVVLHIAVILFYRFVKNENLVKAMILGHRPFSTDSDQAGLAFDGSGARFSPRVAFIVLVLAASGVTALVLLA